MKHIYLFVIYSILVSSPVVSAQDIGEFSKMTPVFKSTQYELIEHIAVSPDSQLFMVWGRYCPLYVLRTKDFSLFKQFYFRPSEEEYISNPEKVKEDPGSTIAAYFYPDSKRLFLGFDSGVAMTVHLYSEKYEKHTITHVAYMSMLSKSGNIMAAENSFINMVNNLHVEHGKNTYTVGMAVTGDDRYLVTGDFRSLVSIIDTSTGKIFYWHPKNWFGFGIRIISVDVAPDNDTIVAGLENGQVRLYSIKAQKEIKSFSGRSKPEAYFSEEGDLVIWTAKKSVIRDLNTGKVKHNWRCPKNITRGMLFPGSRYYAMGLDTGELIILSLDNNEIVFKQKVVQDRIVTINYEPRQKLLFVCSIKGELTCLKPVPDSNVTSGKQ